jgi:hypothetical protein
MTPILDLKPAAVLMPNAKPAAKPPQPQDSPDCPILPTLEKRQAFLSEQYFVVHNGNVQIFFASQKDVARMLSFVWCTFDVEHLMVEHPSMKGDGSIVYLHRCYKKHSNSCQLGAI